VVVSPPEGESLVRAFLQQTRSARLAVAAVTCACGDDYVHIVVEGSSPELSSGPVTVELAVFGGGHGLEHPFPAELRTGVPGSGPDQTSTDFNLVLDEGIDHVDVRVGIATPSGRWSASTLLDPPMDGATRRLVLQPGDRTLGTARLGIGEPGAVARFGSGLATAWASTEGVSLRVDGNPDMPLARQDILDPDRNALQVRIASPPVVPSAPGPERLAVGWVDGTGTARLLYYDNRGKSDVFLVGPAEDLRVTCPDGATAALLIRSGVTARLSFRDDLGAETGAVPLPGSVREVRGMVSVGLAIVAAVRTDQGWQLVRVADRAIAMTRPVDDVLALGHSPTGDQVLTVEVRGADAVVKAYDAARLDPGAPSILVPATELAEGPFGAVDIAGCGVAWPQTRDDGTGSVDLWFRDLDAVGTLAGAPRVLPAVWRGSHLAPRLECTPTGTYAVFAVASVPQAREGTLALRRAPAPPP
jgi:hypothetical protein